MEMIDKFNHIKIKYSHTGEPGLTLPPPDFAPNLTLHVVFAALVGALHRQSLPFEVLQF